MSFYTNSGSFHLTKAKVW